MFKKTQSYKPKTQKESNNLEINRVVIESYYGTNRKNESKIIKINNNVYNIKNIDNNMSRSNLNENINQDNENKIELKSKTLQKISYSSCNQTNFNIVSHIKKFDAPLLINNYSFNFFTKINEQLNNDINKLNLKPENENKKMLLIKSFDIFICGNQNLKAKNIHLTNSTKKDNVVYKEVINLKNSKNEEEEKKIEINKKEEEKNNLLNSLKAINKRWKEEQREFKMRLSYTNKNEVLMINLKKYWEELISNINFEKIDSNNKDNSYIIFKKDLKSKENIYEIIKPTSKKEFDELFNKLCQGDNKENNPNYVNNSDNRGIPMNNEKKKSKFNNQNLLESNKINNLSKNSFYPLLIFEYSELKNIINNIEKDLKIKNEPKENKYILEDNISFNYKGIKNSVIQNQSPKKEKINKTKVLLPSKVDEYKLIHKFENLRKKKIIEFKIEKNDKNEKANTNNIKMKKTKDFGESTPISLLKDKYFIYAVSKWSKYSTINSEINMYFKYNYKSGHPKFDSNILEMSNFYLCIEKIKLEGDTKKSRNTSNFTSFKKTISSSKVTSKTNNEKTSNLKEKGSNISYGMSNNNHTSVNRKKSSTKQNLEKKKNK